MCCDVPEAVLLPPGVAEMLAEYRRLHAATPIDWGGENPTGPGRDYGRWLNLRRLWSTVRETGSWPEGVRRCLPDPLPCGLVVVTVTPSGLPTTAGPAPRVLPGAATEIGVLIDSRVEEEAEVVVAGAAHRVGPGAVALVLAGVTHDRPQCMIGETQLSVAVPTDVSRLRLRSGPISRWAVTDDRAEGWFPEDRLRKWDFHGRPFFHGNDVVLDVPAAPLTVVCTRGMEFDQVTATVAPRPGEEVEVELEPARVYDAAGRGWYGGDLHVHMNYSGDLVCGPHDAALMQRGEGLHLMNLVAGNLLGARIYDREAFEHFAGEDLPWSIEGQLARWGVEFRNDLLGHFHALSPTGPPVRYQTGHERSEHPQDWPPNATACEELRGLGATVGYTHPVFSPLADGTPAGAFVNPRSVEARELVADAALGLVDSVDLLGPNDAAGTAILYHHLLNCGLRLAATVGSDVFLSHSRAGNFSNPPGWARAYADLRGEPLSVAGWQAAMRAGRTFATNGPWLELDVAGHGPGDVVAASVGTTLSVSARVVGSGVEVLEVLGPDGVLAETKGAEGGELLTELTVSVPMWIAAQASGPEHDSVLGPSVFAHTSPVYVEIDGHGVARAGSARWCLDWLNRLEALARAHGRFDTEDQLNDLLAVLDAARGFYGNLAEPTDRG
ncbi:MAG: hypothetical protein E6G27_18375 [Actinobacteria bacterium]|nr:MAG: hypothetical protein E6G27_18375 [Actinomycetota bacterium]